MKPFFVRPHGAMFFGEGTPNTAGESHLMRGLFPMPISAFQGMVRSRLLRGAQPPLSELDPNDRRTRGDRQRVIESMIGSPDALPKGWRLQGPFPAVRDHENGELQPWLAIPRFAACVIEKTGNTPPEGRFVAATVFDDRDPAYRWLHPGAPKPVPSRVWSGHFPPPASKSESNSPPEAHPKRRLGWQGKTKPAEGYVSPTGLYKLLTMGEGKEVRLTGHEFALGPYPPFVAERIRTGGQLRYELSNKGSDKAMADGMLYIYIEHEFADFDKCTKQSIESGWLGFFDFPNLDNRLQTDVLQEGVAELGRRGRSGELSKVESFDVNWQTLYEGQHLGDTFPKGACFWLVLLSPTTTTTHELQHVLQQRASGLNIEVLGGLSTKRQSLGGFSLARQSPHANQYYLMPGSCWLVCIHGNDTDEARRLAVLRDFHNISIEADADQAAFGYGHVFCSKPFSL